MIKNTGLRNPFKRDELDKWFYDNYECWICGRNHWDCFHHGVGRGYGDSKCESSILNAVPANNFECHLRVHGELRKEENITKLLKKTIRFLLNKGYEFSDLDVEFYNKYKKHYE